MSNSALKVLAGAGATEDPVYVDDVFSTFLYEGTGSSQDISNGLDLATEGGLTWIKSRETSENHALYDSLRGTKPLFTNSTTDQSSSGPKQTTLLTNGFRPGTDGLINGSGNDYLSWSFLKKPGFFDVKEYTGNGSTKVLSHDLECKPGLVIVKQQDGSSNWGCYARDGSNDSEIGIGYLNLTSAFTTSGIAFSATDTAVTIYSSSFNFDATANGSEFIVYFFAMGGTDSNAAVFGDDGDESIIRCGKYSGDGNTAGPTIDVGFEPQWLLIKSTTSGDSWGLFDSMRGMPSLPSTPYVYANGSAAEANNDQWVALTPTGFYLKNSHDFVNGSGQTYFYMAIRRPHKPAEKFAATDLFKTVTGRSDSGSPSYVTGFVTDMGIQRAVASADNNFIMARQAGNKYSYTNSNTTSFANTGSSIAFDYMNGALDYFSSAAYRWWGWRRAPGFFDVVTWKGTGSAKTIPHNLGVAPEMIWVFTRDYGERHAVYSKVSGNQAWLDLSYTYSANADSAGAYWNSTDPTASVFSVGTNYRVNDSSNSYGLYYGFLFASVAGISKVGSYTGTGGDINVDCGFSNGARFVLIKTTTWSSGHWFLFDSERGMSSGNDPYIVLDTTAVSEEGALDAIDPLSSGFIVKGTAGDGMNKSGETYLFYAIA
jgi:hypothetical protein